jgi:hypothetical protein
MQANIKSEGLCDSPLERGRGVFVKRSNTPLQLHHQRAPSEEGNFKLL